MKSLKISHEESRAHLNFLRITMESKRKILIEQYARGIFLDNISLKEDEIVDNDVYSTFEKLSHEIIARYNKFNPNREENSRREEFRRNLEAIIREKLFPDSDLYMFGSSFTGLYIENSDIDFCLLTSGRPYSSSGQRTSDTPNESSIFRSLYKMMREMGVSRVILLLNARVPILKLTSAQDLFPFKFDLCLNRTLGIRNSELMRAYVICDYRVKALMFFLKSWSKVMNLHNSSSAFNSYCLQLLLIFFLQTRPIPVLPNLQSYPENLNSIGSEHFCGTYNCWFDRDLARSWRSENKESPGELLIRFFKYFSEFDFKTYAISVRTASALLKSEVSFPSNPVCVEDPFETDFNCARLIGNRILDYSKNVFNISYRALLYIKDLEALVPKFI